MRKKFCENNLYYRRKSSIDQPEAIIIVHVWVEKYINLHVNIEDPVQRFQLFDRL
jgi:hypothetical protein